MKFIKQSTRRAPKVSLVLLDWSVRESFHLLHYLTQQTVDRDSFEVIVIEYYSRVAEALRPFEDQVDTWVVMEMPESSYYHKHLMYNLGIILSRGEIVMLGDADAMVKPTFIERIIGAFRGNADVVYHIDQFRNLRRDLYPFNFPSFESVEGPGCVNARAGKTIGVLDDEDPVHSRNYGACMCARRSDLIRIGGADEHIDYLGHICGPYDLTFRLCNLGYQEVWDTEEFTYHTWHPGSAGVDNYLGPQDGRHMSTTALEALTSGRTEPLLENPAIQALRIGAADVADALDRVVDKDRVRQWDAGALRTAKVCRTVPGRLAPVELYKGFRLMDKAGEIVAYPIRERSAPPQTERDPPAAVGNTIEDARREVDRLLRRPGAAVQCAATLYAYAGRILDSVRYRAGLMPAAIPMAVKIATIGVVALPGITLAALIFPHRIISLIEDARRDALSLTSLAAAIQQQTRVGKSDEVTVLVPGQRPLAFLRMVQAIGLLGPAKILAVRTGRDLAACLGQLERDGVRRRMVLPAVLFTRFYGLILHRGLAARMLIA